MGKMEEELILRIIVPIFYFVTRNLVSQPSELNQPSFLKDVKQSSDARKPELRNVEMWSSK